MLAGFIIVCVGVVGLYVGRIFEQVKDRPLYLIDAQAEGPSSSQHVQLAPDLLESEACISSSSR